MKDEFKVLIADEFANCVKATIHRIGCNKPTRRPFHTALLSDEIIFWSSFERSFSTSFGQRVIEEIARIVALSNGATDAQRQKETILNIDQAYLHAVSEYMQRLRDGDRSELSWEDTMNMIDAVQPSGKIITKRIISDLWWQKDGVDHYISLKTVKPNIDQTAVAKEDCMLLKASDRSCKVYFGLPYNPYGDNRKDYAHTPPMGIFDFHNDEVVLIGKEMWDTIGGDGCYEEILEIAESVGVCTRKAINSIYNKNVINEK